MNAVPKQTHIVSQWKHDGGPLINCRFDPTGNYVFATAEDRQVLRWELKSGNKVSFSGHDSWARGIAFSHDGQTVVTSGYDDTLIWWPVAAEKPEPIHKVKAHKGWIRALAVSPDGTILASGGNDRMVKLWNMKDGSLIREMSKPHELDVYSLAFHPQDGQLLSGDLMGKVHQWTVADGKLTRVLEAKDLHTYNGGQQVHYGGIRSIAFTPDGKQMACAGLTKATNPLGAVNEPMVVRFDYEPGKILKKHMIDGVKGIAWRALFHPEGHLIGCSGGSGGGFLAFWNAKEDKAFHKLKMPDTARECDLHPDGMQVATVHFDRHLRISKMAAKQEK